MAVDRDLFRHAGCAKTVSTPKERPRGLTDEDLIETALDTVAVVAPPAPPPPREPGAIYDIWRLLDGVRYEREAEVRGHCRNAYLGGGTSLCRVLGRYKMYVDTADIGIASHLLLDGFWEMWVTEAMMRIVRPGMTAIDVGANLGYFTVLLADLAGPSGRVLAFEPNPAIAGRLRKTVAVNGFAPTTTVHECALGAADGQVMMDVTADQPGGGRTVEYTGDDGAVAVPVHRLDEVDGALEADFIKIDVEGAEQLVWGGMTGILNTGRPLTIFMEFTVARYGDAAGFLTQILDAGFSLGIVDYTRGVIPIGRDELFAQSHLIDHMLVFQRA